MVTMNDDEGIPWTKEEIKHYEDLEPLLRPSTKEEFHRILSDIALENFIKIAKHKL